MATGLAARPAAGMAAGADGAAARSDAKEAPTADATTLGNALEHFATAFAGKMAGKHVLAFMDYDGTLTPIVARPEDAKLPRAAKDALRRLATTCASAAIVTGRSLRKIADFVALDVLYYAGSHGFDIRGPRRRDDDGDDVSPRQQHPALLHSVARSMRPVLERTMADLRDAVADIDGAELEDNHMAVTVHYRAVAASQVARVEAVVDRYIEAAGSHLVKHHGKKVFELRPRVDWNKGKAIDWLVQHISKELMCTPEDIFAFYIGDDVSDEDGFTAVNAYPNSCSVLVTKRPSPTHATFTLTDPTQVHTLLNRIADTATPAVPSFHTADGCAGTATVGGDAERLDGTATVSGDADRLDGTATVSGDADRLDGAATPSSAVSLSATLPPAPAVAGAGAGAGAGATLSP